MSCKELSLGGFIDEMKDVSEGSHSRKFCFVVGAGASRTSGIPSGKELVDLWNRELLNRNKEDYLGWKEKFGITDENKYTHYSRYYEKRFESCPRDGYNSLEKLMDQAKPSSGYVMLAYMLARTEHNVAITTNFDHLTEDSINYYFQELPRVIGHESLAPYIGTKIKRPTILKIHRDLLFDPHNKVDEVETLHEKWVAALDIIFEEYHPVFIGYAGNDNSLMDYLIAKSEQFSSNKLCFPYWMLYENDKLDGKIETFLEQSNGYFVKHGGFDEVLYLMAAKFGYTLPTEEEFIGESKTRYTSLQKAIHKFTELATQKENLKERQPDSKIIEAVQKVSGGEKQQNPYTKASMLFLSKKYEEALSEMQKAIDADPNNARYHNLLGYMLHSMKRYDEALVAKQKAVELEPNNHLYLANLGATLHNLKRYDEALVAEQKAVELEPNNPLYLASLGATLHDLKRYDEALVAKQKTVELEPNDPLYLDNLGITLHALKRYDEALVATQKAKELGYIDE